MEGISSLWSLWGGASVFLGAAHVCSHMVLSDPMGSLIENGSGRNCTRIIWGGGVVAVLPCNFFYWLLPFPNIAVCTKAGQIFIQNLHAASVHQKVKSGGDVCRQNRFLHSVQLSQAVKKLSGNVPLH